jgi:siroheme synthase
LLLYCPFVFGGEELKNHGVAARPIAPGMPAPTQTGAVESASRSNQRRLFSTIVSLPSDLAAAFEGPTMALAGAGVTLSARLRVVDAIAAQATV